MATGDVTFIIKVVLQEADFSRGDYLEDANGKTLTDTERAALTTKQMAEMDLRRLQDGDWGVDDLCEVGDIDPYDITIEVEE